MILGKSHGISVFDRTHAITSALGTAEASPHMLVPIDAFTYGGHDCAVLELVGPDLFCQRETSGPVEGGFPARWVRKVALDALQSLAYLHEHGVSHGRESAPSPVLVFGSPCPTYQTHLLRGGRALMTVLHAVVGPLTLCVAWTHVDATSAESVQRAYGPFPQDDGRALVSYNDTGSGVDGAPDDLGFRVKLQDFRCGEQPLPFRPGPATAPEIARDSLRDER